MAVESISDDVVVSLIYTLTVDGEEVERADRDDPLEYLHGTGSIVPGLEMILEGKRVGDKIHATLPPDQTYGDYDPEEVEQVDRDSLEIDVDVEPGVVVEVEDEDGELYVATITEITDDLVTLDFNPPLAGKTLTYDVEVIGLREATEDELDHGHVH